MDPSIWLACVCTHAATVRRLPNQQASASPTPCRGTPRAECETRTEQTHLYGSDGHSECVDSLPNGHLQLRHGSKINLRHRHRPPVSALGPWVQPTVHQQREMFLGSTRVKELDVDLARGTLVSYCQVGVSARGESSLTFLGGGPPRTHIPGIP